VADKRDIAPASRQARTFMRIAALIMLDAAPPFDALAFSPDLAEGDERPSTGTYRLEVDDRTGEAWICTPDHQRLAPLRSRVSDPKPSLFVARFVSNERRALVQRFGRDRATWSTDWPRGRPTRSS
jgi:hypothetical protein